ncbi:Bifunctional homocysteine S-methyltransferase/5,10-methylenetetrahydrofolate reductase [Bacillus safensis subsp. safensis]
MQKQPTDNASCLCTRKQRNVGGSIRTFNKNATLIEEIKRSFREQLYILLNEEPDGLLLETYYDIEEAKAVLQIARKETTLPIVMNVSMHEQGVLQDGTPLKDGLSELSSLGADVVGINCRLGPYHMIQALEGVPLFGKFAFICLP